MDDLAQEIAVMRDGLKPEWDDARSERLFVGTLRLRQRRRARRVVAAGALCAAAAGMLVFGVQQVGPRGSTAAELAGRDVPGVKQPVAGVQASPQPTAAVAAVALARPLTEVRGGQQVRLADGSAAVVRSSQGVLEVMRNEPRRIELRLRDSLAHFDVVPNGERQFVVAAGSLQVLVVGTVFDVEQQGERVRVSVSEGKVRVLGERGSEFVVEGETAWFDDTGARIASERAEPAPARREHAARSKRTQRAEPASDAAGSWRTLSQNGDYEEAYRMIASGTPVEDDPAALMLAADAARLSGHPEASVSYFKRVLRDHRDSPLAGLAGFTLGRVLLERLGQPSEAAEAFALARKIAPDGSLAQDALAREVEAWSKAGNTHEAYQRAQQYVAEYPNGRRLRAVRLYGGLE